MNFIKGKVVQSGRDSIIEYSRGKLLLTPEKAEKVKEAGYMGKDVIFGIRPEHVHYCMPEEYSDEVKDAQFEIYVDVLEALGSEQIIFFQFDDNEYAAKAVDTNVKAGDKIRLSIDIRKIHIFDADTKTTIQTEHLRKSPAKIYRDRCKNNEICRQRKGFVNRCRIMNVIGYAKGGGKVGKEKVTIYDVSERLGVSTATVNRALNGKPRVSEKMRQRVIEVAAEMGYKASKTASSMSRRGIKIGVIMRTIRWHFEGSRTGVRVAFSELADFKVIGITRITTPEAGKEEYENLIWELAEKGCEGIAILPSNVETGLEETISKVRARGIVLGTCVSDYPFSKRHLSVRNNGMVAGKLAAQLLYWLVGDAPVALVTGFRDSIVHRETIQGFRSFMETTPMNFAGIYEHRDDPEIAYYLATRMMKERPDIKGIYFGTANSVTFCKRLEELNRMGDIRIVASDLMPEIIEYIRKGVIDATIFQNPHAQGRTLIKKIYGMIAENYRPECEVFYLNPQPVFASNLELYLQGSAADAKKC